MPKPRAKELVPDLENMIFAGQKKFVRYDNGKELYSVCDKTLRDWVRKSGAEYKIGRMVQSNTACCHLCPIKYCRRNGTLLKQRTHSFS